MATGGTVSFPFWGTHEPITLFDTQKPIYAESGTPLVSHRDNPSGVETRFEARRHDAGREGREVADYAAYTEVLLSNREDIRFNIISKRWSIFI